MLESFCDTANDMQTVKVKVILCRKLPAYVSDIDPTKAQLQSDLHTAQMKIDELQKEVRLHYLELISCVS